jgi:hypothetical protein
VKGEQQRFVEIFLNWTRMTFAATELFETGLGTRDVLAVANKVADRSCSASDGDMWERCLSAYSVTLGGASEHARRSVRHFLPSSQELPARSSRFVLRTAGGFREARCGLIANVTPLEPEWEGQVTIEISNTTPLPARIYANEGICQFLFLRGETPPEVSYADRAGKYMHQRGVALPKL